jgi:hypothetical protein
LQVEVQLHQLSNSYDTDPGPTSENVVGRCTRVRSFCVLEGCERRVGFGCGARLASLGFFSSLKERNPGLLKG